MHDTLDDCQGFEYAYRGETFVAKQDQGYQVSHGRNAKGSTSPWCQKNSIVATRSSDGDESDDLALVRPQEAGV